MNTQRSLMAMLVSLSVTLLASAARAETPEAPWPGPRAAYVFLEAEAFSSIDAGWKTIESREGKHDELVASGLHALSGASKGDGEASHEFDVPAAGEYRVWLRWSEMQGDAEATKSAGVALRIEQAGKTVGEGAAPDAATTESAEKLRRPTAVYRWVSVATRVPLAAGRAKVVLAKAGKPTANAALRRVDAVLVTKDSNYAPDYRDFASQTYVRVRLKNPTTPSAERGGEYFLYQRVTTPRQPRGRLISPLKPGQPSGWLNITRMATGDAEVNVPWQLSPEPESSEFSIDFATAPREDAIVKSIDRTGPGGQINIRVPPDLTGLAMPVADFEMARARAELAAKLPVPTFGKLPVKFPLVADARVSPPAERYEVKVLRYCGINAHTGLLTEQDVADGFTLCRLYNSVFYTNETTGHLEPDFEKITKDISRHAEEVKANRYADRIQDLKLIDEAGAMPIERFLGNAKIREMFRAWMAKNNFDPFTPEDRAKLKGEGKNIADAIEPVDRASAYPGLYYYTQRFRAWSVANYFVQTSAIVRQHYPSNVLATQNFSDGAVFVGNMYAQGNDYYEYFKNRALDVAQSEDWTNAGATRQLTGWNVALLRSAAKYHNQPVHMYLITYSGRKPLEVKLKALSNIAQGAKQLIVYSYAPKYAGSEAGWAENPMMFPAIAELSREIGAAEDVLMDAMPRRAEAAILYSIPSDIWTAGVDTSPGCERMFTYIALRHAQVPVDIISDEDARGSELKGRKVVYLFGEQLDPATAAPLAAWVREGGTLVLSPGAGSRETFNRPNAALDQALGINRPAAKTLETINAANRGVCEKLEAKGSVKLAGSGGTAELLASSQVSPVGGEVLATFESGEPAASAFAVGKGRVVTVGFNPAIAYVRGALKSLLENDSNEEVVPLRAVAEGLAATDPAFTGKAPADIRLLRKQCEGLVPFRFDAALREFIAAPAKQAKVDLPVTTDVPVVEATMMDGKQGWVVPLANYSGRPIATLTVTIKPGRASGEIRSSRRGVLKPETLPDGSLRVSLPLESTDFLYAVWTSGATP